jgi:hypothetical protein
VLLRIIVAEIILVQEPGLGFFGVTLGLVGHGISLRSGLFSVFSCHYKPESERKRYKKTSLEYFNLPINRLILLFLSEKTKPEPSGAGPVLGGGATE